MNYTIREFKKPEVAERRFMANRRITLYIAESLNGYIATPEHNLDWLLSTEGEGDNGFKAYYDSIDTILFGRVIRKATIRCGIAKKINIRLIEKK